MSKTQQLHKLLTEGNKPDVVCHNNPDSDCLASALALGRIAADTGIDEWHIFYSGNISHQQNRAFINLLDIDLQPFESASVQDRPADSLLALVDHSVPGANNRVSHRMSVDIVIDHHPTEAIDARFVDHREEIGPTATILTKYIRTLDIHPDTALATALLFALRRETLDFLHGTTRQEYGAAGYLHDHVDNDLLWQLSLPSVAGATLDAIGTAIENRTMRGRCSSLTSAG